MFVAADSLNNAATMEVRECLHVFFCICVQVFISSRRVPVCEPPVLKKKRKTGTQMEKKIGGQTGRRDEVNQANHHFDLKNTHYVHS